MKTIPTLWRTIMEVFCLYSMCTDCFLDRFKWIQLNPLPLLFNLLMIHIHPVSVPMGERPLNGFSQLLFSVSVVGIYFSSKLRFLQDCTLLVCTKGAVNVTVSAQAERSQSRCGTEVVIVPEKGRIDIVTRSLLVLVSVNHPSGVWS